MAVPSTLRKRLKDKEGAYRKSKLSNKWMPLKPTGPVDSGIPFISRLIGFNMGEGVGFDKKPCGTYEPVWAYQDDEDPTSEINGKEWSWRFPYKDTLSVPKGPDGKPKKDAEATSIDIAKLKQLASLIKDEEIEDALEAITFLDEHASEGIPVRMKFNTYKKGNGTEGTDIQFLECLAKPDDDDDADADEDDDADADEEEEEEEAPPPKKKTKK